MYLYYILQEGAQNGFDEMFREIDIDFTKFFVKLLSRKNSYFTCLRTEATTAGS